MGFETSLGMELEMTEFLILCQLYRTEPDFYLLITLLPPPNPHHVCLVKENGR